jgi:UDP-N-acetylglucosamine acyltransferase
VNSVALAGHVEVGNWAIISGLSAVHQFVKIGAHAMIGGGAMVRKDVPPYITAAGEPLGYAGINSVGLKRRNFTPEEVSDIQDMYRVIYQSGKNISQAVDSILNSHPDTPNRKAVLDFIEKSNRGLIRK